MSHYWFSFSAQFLIATVFSICVCRLLSVHELVWCLFSHFVEIRSIAQPTLVGGVYRTEQYTFSLCGYSIDFTGREGEREGRERGEREREREREHLCGRQH